MHVSIKYIIYKKVETYLLSEKYWTDVDDVDNTHRLNFLYFPHFLVVVNSSHIQSDWYPERSEMTFPVYNT